jgi:hypothetical protein
MYFRKNTTDGRAYLQIVESRREGAAVRQQIIATLGRLEDLQESGQLERLLRSGARFADKAIVLDALYRAMAWLGEELPENQQEGATPFAPRCVKEVLEEELFACRRDLLTTLDVVFMDTTSPRIKSGGRGRPDARAARLLQRSSTRSRPDDSGRAARRRRPARMHGDVAREYGRRRG